MKKLLAASILAAAPFAAFAGTATGNFDITVNVLDSCTISDPSNITIDYDYYNPTTTSGSTSATISCIANSTYTLKVDGTDIAGTSQTLNIDLQNGSKTLPGTLDVTVSGATYSGTEFTTSGTDTVDFNFSINTASVNPADLVAGEQYSKTINIEVIY
ncbi:hypothetical protein GWK41_03265 [Persephonella atlantica]|uniref:Spore coat protein U domain-containing protein n=1 Tax=Persephonella atlantica TaxID=2699429 RepID=A0ABS1GGM7_9AQUI|nr:hypothetical protein [Persephonella atlantica]MBK3332087.1 hypothetical protein [Persephonella atlantica]